MGIMDYIPQFGDNVNQDVSGYPADDAMAQLQLKRRLAQADALRNAEMPEGQMVSGHYVAPALTQYAANLYGKYKGGKESEKAMSDYNMAQQTKQQRYADLLSQSDNAEFQKNLAQMPEFQQDLVKSRIANMNKNEVPVQLAAGGLLVNPSTGQVIARNPKDSSEQSMFGKINPADYTPESVRKFMQSKDYGDLQFNAAARQAGQTPYYQALPTAQGYAQFNARTGQLAPLPMGGQSVLPAAQDPRLQGQLSGSRFLGEAETKRSFNMAGAPDIVNEARNILTGKVKPTGSGLGTMVDVAGATVGVAPRGAAQADQLRAISGQLVAKMPRMEGPQSDRDVALYTQMAGQIGDSTIPVSRRLEALKTVEGIVSKYATKQQPAAMSSQDQQALNWANANPNDPRATAIKQKLGVR
jgi:hypothetical protein